MPNLNKVQIIGHLGQDPETRTFQDGAQVCNLSIATSEKWNDKQTGEKKEHTEWHRVSLFGKLAEIAGQYLSKGQPVYIEGSLRTRKWQDKSGQDRYTTEIIADQMQMLGNKPSEPGHKQAAAGDAQAYRNASNGGGAPGLPNDDIPFAPYERGRIA